MVLFPNDGAWGSGVMEELSFECMFLPAGDNRAYCRVSKHLDHHHLWDGASQPTYGSWCHHVLHEKDFPRLRKAQPKEESSDLVWSIKALPMEEKRG